MNWKFGGLSFVSSQCNRCWKLISKYLRINYCFEEERGPENDKKICVRE